MRNNFKEGFTLAEVLITLGIIGVVAAMTIPTLINNYQKTQYVTQLKQAYSLLNQALIQLAADHSCVGDLRCTGLFDNGTTNDDVGQELAKYFKITKSCGTTDPECSSKKVSMNYDGTNVTDNWYASNSDYYSFVIASGASILINNWSTMGNPGCPDPGWSAGITNNLKQVCGEVLIDVNGPNKGPNYFGRDWFDFFITNGKGPALYPEGGIDFGDVDYWKDPSGNPQYCYENNPNGFYCGGRIIDENWKMNYWQLLIYQSSDPYLA